MEIAGQPLPLQQLSTVWHIGSFEPADKGCRGSSLEGTGLSVSVDPEAWQAIARLGGLPWWRLSRRNGAFLDFHALDKAQRDALMAWGLEAGWLQMQPQWELSYYDSEVDDTRMCTFDTEQAAADELEELSQHDETAKVDAVHRGCPTELMTARLGFKTSPFNALDIAATFWVEDHTALDGVWWEDLLEPHNLSAPRGVIVCRALPGWRRQKSA